MLVKVETPESSPTHQAPTIEDALWLKKVGLALCALGVAKNCRVNFTDWERTGCLQLDLELFPSQESAASDVWRVKQGQEIVSGPHSQNQWRRFSPKIQAMKYVRRYQRFLIPVAACAAHDTKWVLKQIVDDSDLGKIVATETDLAFVHGG